MGRGLQANLGISRSCGDGHKDGSERAELLFSLASAESERDNGIDPHHLARRPDRLHPLLCRRRDFLAEAEIRMNINYDNGDWERSPVGSSVISATQ